MNRLSFVWGIIFLILVAFSCKPKTSSGQIEDLQKLEELSTTLNLSDTLTAVISTVLFELKATREELPTFEDGIVPWISLENTKDEIDRLIGGDEIVIQANQVNVIIDYPLNNPITLKLKTTNSGFSRKELILAISKKYHEIYEEEELTAIEKTVPAEKREGLINRNQTNGKYGIWGHDLSDLDLSEIEVHKDKRGEVVLILGIES